MDSITLPVQHTDDYDAVVTWHNNPEDWQRVDCEKIQIQTS